MSDSYRSRSAGAVRWVAFDRAGRRLGEASFAEPGHALLYAELKYGLSPEEVKLVEWTRKEGRGDLAGE